MSKIRCEYCQQRNDAERDDCAFCGAELPDRKVEYWPGGYAPGTFTTHTVIDVSALNRPDPLTKSYYRVITDGIGLSYMDVPD